jgi:glycosyltransferase involved in cell wall biosynthesis
LSADVSVVITTHDRIESCVRAIRSALNQEPPPLEVIVCDDASQDGTADRLREWAEQEQRLRYERFNRPRGGPAAGRNRGLALARGNWVAFLDDDDAWRPGKLARQLAVARDADVVATNARRSDGTSFFPAAPEVWRPARSDLLRTNPVILSSALVRRAAVPENLFDERAWLAGIEDYAAWLRLADAGGRFLVLSDELVDYEDAGEQRYGAAVLRSERRLVRLAWERWIHVPTDLMLLRAALAWSAGLAVTMRARLAARRAARRAPRSHR